MSSKGVVPDQAELNIVNAMLLAASGTLTYRLFQNQFGVQDSTVIGDFTEATYAGYAPINSTPTPVSAPEGIGGYTGNMANLPFLTLNFPSNAGSPQTIYGLYVTFDTGSGPELLYASNVFDGHGGFTSTPDGVTVNTGMAPPPIFSDFSLWDFGQPTP